MRPNEQADQRLPPARRHDVGERGQRKESDEAEPHRETDPASWPETDRDLDAGTAGRRTAPDASVRLGGVRAEADAVQPHVVTSQNPSAHSGAQPDRGVLFKQVSAAPRLERREVYVSLAEPGVPVLLPARHESEEPSPIGSAAGLGASGGVAHGRIGPSRRPSGAGPAIARHEMPSARTKRSRTP